MSHILKVALVGILFSPSAFAQDAWIPDFKKNEYKKVYETLKQDTLLSRMYCGTDSLRLAVHPKFQYFPVKGFVKFIENQGVGKQKIKSILKQDQKLFKNQNLMTYKYMTDDFYSVFERTKEPCAILCFDTLRENFLIVQLTSYDFGLEWDRVAGNKNLYVFIFDLSKYPYRYAMVEHVR